MREGRLLRRRFTFSTLAAAAPGAAGAEPGDDRASAAAAAREPEGTLPFFTVRNLTLTLTATLTLTPTVTVTVTLALTPTRCAAPSAAVRRGGSTSSSRAGSP